MSDRDPEQSYKLANAELAEASWQFARKARSEFIRHRTSGNYVSTISNVMKVERFESGFPHITQDFSARIPDYSRHFSIAKGEWTPIGYETWSSYKTLVDVVEADERFQRSFMMAKPEKDGDEFAHRMWSFEVMQLPLAAFDRLMHLYGEFFTYEQFLSVYGQLERGSMEANLPIVFGVPILMTKFDFDVELVDSNMAVIKMDENLQIAKAERWSETLKSTSSVVANAATHLLILTGWTMPNTKGIPNPGYTELEWHPTDRIDRFFDALRVVSGIDTGYAEVFIVPERGAWAHRFNRDLPPVIYGASTRRYPSDFDNFGWLKQRDTLNSDHLSEVREVYEQLSDRADLELAGRRLGAGMLREDQDDSILDLLIGLEAILSDQDKGELTHKLALRTSALLSLNPGNDPQIIFPSVKKLYSYRSAVSHGDQERANKLREIEIDGETKDSIQVAQRFLREAIRILVARKDLDSPKSIDRDLILESLIDRPDPFLNYSSGQGDSKL